MILKYPSLKSRLNVLEQELQKIILKVRLSSDDQDFKKQIDNIKEHKEE